MLLHLSEVHKDVNRSTFFGHYIAYVRDLTCVTYVAGTVMMM